LEILCLKALILFFWEKSKSALSSSGTQLQRLEKFDQCSADIASNGTDDGDLLNAQLISPPMELMLEEVLNKCSAFINTSLISCEEHQMFRIMNIKLDGYCSKHLSLFA
jgi:hypothetical protein